MLAIGLSYLWGAIPTAYLVALYLKGIDLRTHGSGNIGASNVFQHVNLRTGLVVGIFDSLFKGTMPIAIARILNLELPMEISIGIAAITGHCWSPYIRFAGGRGIATSIGVLVGLFLWKELLVEAILMGLIGRAIMKQTGFWTFVSIIVLAPLTLLFDQPIEVTYCAISISTILLIKRVTANWEAFPDDNPVYRVLTYRLLFDRDVSPNEEWTTRHPRQD